MRSFEENVGNILLLEILHCNCFVMIPYTIENENAIINRDTTVILIHTCACRVLCSKILRDVEINS